MKDSAKNKEKLVSLYTQLSDEQRVQKLNTIKNEINKEGIYKGNFEEKFKIGEQLFNRYSFELKNKQINSDKYESLVVFTDNQLHYCSIN